MIPLIVLSQQVTDARHAIEHDLGPETCEPLLQGWHDQLATLTPSEVDFQDVHENGPRIVADLVAARVEGQRAMRTMQADGTLTPSCLTALRRADLASRYLADHVLEVLPPEDRPDGWLTADGSAFDPSHDLRSGDVLVTRGTALSSAGIAHMGRVDSQFSHNALVYVDPNGKAWTIEAYLERGALVQPLDDFLNHGLGRAVVVRHHDADRAARAAEAAYERVAHGRPIRYDAGFDLDDGSTLFCSEVPRWAFGSLIGEPSDVPVAPTVFPRDRNPAMFDAMGIEVEVTSAPADLLYDPAFELVAEWRDVDALPTLRRHDAVVESVLTWMEEDGYELEAHAPEKNLVGFGRTVRGIPVLGLALKGTLSPGLDADFLVTSLALQKAAEELDAQLVEALDGHDTPPRLELLDLTEGLRAADLRVWTESERRSTFHRWLHPR